jgi:hypothetical protein
MSNEAKDLVSLLHVGESAVLTLSPGKSLAPRYKTAIRGWNYCSFIIFDRPRVRDHYVRLEKGEPCVVRFLSHGKACGFDSVVVDYDMRQEKPSCALLWPKSFELVSFRRYERVALFIPCMVEIDGEKIEGEVQDVSLNGCRISISKVVENNSLAKVSFDLPDGSVAEDLEVRVRNQQDSGFTVVLGCEFEPGQEFARSDIAFFVASTLERGMLDKKSAKRVFIIDADPNSSSILYGMFEDNGWQAFVADNSVEGLLRLRILPPVALVINEAQQDMMGAAVLRLIKESKGLSNLRIFIYRGKDEVIRNCAKEAGLSGYFQEGEPFARVCSAVIGSVES